MWFLLAVLLLTGPAWGFTPCCCVTTTTAGPPTTSTTVVTTTTTSTTAPTTTSTTTSTVTTSTSTTLTTTTTTTTTTSTTTTSTTTTTVTTSTTTTLTTSTTTTTTTSTTTTTTLFALDCTSLTMGDAGVNQTSGTTASISPASNALLIASIVNNKAGGGDVPNSVTGNSLTWVCDAGATILYPSNVNRATLCRALGASPTTGAVTIDYNGVTQAQIHWNIVQCTGVDTTGTNGSGAFLNPTTDTTTAVTSQTITLPAFTLADDRAVFVQATEDPSGAITPGSGCTDLGQQEPHGFLRSFTEVCAPNDTTADATFANAGFHAAVAVEVKAP